MSGEIQIGMSFGSFYASTSALGQKYRSEDDFDARKSHINYYDEKDNLVAVSKKDLVGNNVLFSISDQKTNRVYESTKTVNRDATLNGDIKFDRIYATNTYAVDLNHNGIVDKGEIFERANGEIQSDWLF